MVYHKKTSRGKYGMAALQEAVEKVRSGEISKRQAKKQYGVPHKTLSCYMSNKVDRPGSLARFQCVLGENLEHALVEHVITLQRMLFGLSTADLRKLAFEIAQYKKIDHPFQNNTAGKKWLCGFLQRNPNLSIRSPEPTSLGRAIGINEPTIQSFMNLYRSELDKERFTPDCIYNVDETGLTVVHRPRKVLASKGEKQVGKVTSEEKGEQ
jgi:hypothetical protein